MASEPPPTAAEAVEEIVSALKRLGSRGMPARQAVALLLGLAAKAAKWEKGEGWEHEFVEAARFYYREVEVRDGN